MPKDLKDRPKPTTGRNRVIIEHVHPEIDAGRFPAKRVVGDIFTVEADIFGDGHDHVEARLLYREANAPAGSKQSAPWTTVPMIALGNDRFTGSFPLTTVGRYQYTLAASIDHFDTWRSGLEKKRAAGQDLSVELLNGALLLDQASDRAKGDDRQALKSWAKRLRKGSGIEKAEKPSKAEKKSAAPAPSAKADEAVVEAALSEELATLIARYPNTSLETRYLRELDLTVDRERARFSTWYELFPRSSSPTPGQHGTFRDTEALLPYIQDLGFDILYLPPIHPIGRSYRKGKNNTVTAEPGDVGSPWAIGAAEGGHTEILSELGTLEDFQHLRGNAEARGIELALDIAFQCAPDHPWVKEHPAWFKHRADGTIQYAENPPKKYQDIYPIDFESTDWENLWEALRGVFLYWIEQGVKIFRVDNPHTKAFPFWEWTIQSIKARYPDVLFLAEAFTRPRVMEQLAKLGFSQSYSYFAWRTTREELESYGRELTEPSPCGDGQYEYFRSNFWPNTPDILPANVQSGGRPAFALRLVLAATLNGNYGIYGPAYELLEDTPFKPGGEEYLHSEKYELKHWNRDDPRSLAPLIRTINQARRDNPALQRMDPSLHFHQVDNPHLICYSKQSPVAGKATDGTALAGANTILTIVNLDPAHRHTGWVYLWIAKLGLTDDSTYTVEDLLTGAQYTWHGPGNFVALDPQVQPAHIFRVQKFVPDQEKS